jgi:hypothetical protein
MKTKFDNIHDLENIEKYYFFADDILFSTQFTLLYSLTSFMLDIENFFEALENIEEFNNLSEEEKNKRDHDPNDIDIELPEDDDLVELFKDYASGDDRLEKIYDQCSELLNDIKGKLGIENPDEIHEKILLREDEVFITLEDLFSIYDGFPLQLKTITSGVCDGMVSFPNQFKKTHKIVFKNKLEYNIYKNIVSPVNTLELEYDIVLDFLYIDDLEEDISEELKTEDEALIYISTVDKEIIEKYLEEYFSNVLILLPTNYGFINKDDFPTNRILETGVW